MRGGIKTLGRRPKPRLEPEEKTLGRRPKPRLEPSFGEGSKDSKNFTAKGTRRGGTWRHVLRFRVPFAVKLLEFLGLFRKEALSGVWGGASKSSPSLRSVRELEVGWLRYAGAPACFALIRHWRATFPTRGKAWGGCDF